MIADSQPSVLRNIYVQHLTIVQVTEVHTSIASSKPKVELDSHADTVIVGDNCSVIHDLNRPVNVYRYDQKDGHRSAKTFDAAVGYQDPQSGQNDKSSYLHRWVSQPSPMHMNGVHISEVLKFLAEIQSKTTHSIELVDPLDVAHPFIILF